MGDLLLRDGEHTENIGGRCLIVSHEDTFGADQLLLGDFAAFRPGESVCDLGSGCGILAFEALADGAGPVTTVEIRPESCDMLRRSLALSHARAQVVCADLRDYETQERFDVVVMNPPYFDEGSGPAARSVDRQAQRSAPAGIFRDASACAARIMAPGGRFCFCTRPDRLTRVISGLSGAGLALTLLRFAAASHGKRPFLLLGMAVRDSGSSLVISRDIYTDSNEMTLIYSKYS